ncbi:MAG: serine/threonine-protein phosphatase [Actinobacteria bacterium]|nr:serine/threonine-protein phosphatase [Actinomycetota bacterium]NBR67649.1 serine/threonine-protein phosphatase [Actinomycetota bacterium]
MTRTITFVHGAATHTGQLRRVNQDAFGVGDGVFVVADGLGGHNAGEVASALAVEAVLAGTADGVEGPEQFGNAVGAANRAVFDASQQDTGLHGMGTTVTAIVALPGPGGRVAVANVGDSRTSLYRAGDFIRVTKDHSRVQEMIDAGEISPDDEWGHPYGNVLTRAVGLEPHVEVDVYVITAEPRDRFLLCSDGLIDEVREEDIAEALWRHRDPQECADRLVDMANEAGGHDNITVIVVDVLAGDAA